MFPILWNLDGDVVESFSPDFYLPDLDLYVELTTLRQPLVRKKNRKLRRLRELYPDIRIKLFYARDFRALMLKYGKFGLGRAAVRDARPGRARRRRRRLPCPTTGLDEARDLTVGARPPSVPDRTGSRTPMPAGPRSAAKAAARGPDGGAGAGRPTSPRLAA